MGAHSRASKPRASKHRRRAPPPPVRATGARADPGTPSSRREQLQSARRRAVLAKAVLGSAGALVFGAAMAFSRHSYAGHPKHPASALSAPPRFVSIVRHNLLQAGIVAPAQAPPGAKTAVS